MIDIELIEGLSIDDAKFIGIIRKIRQVGTNVHIGNFILNPEYTNRGFGKIALRKFIDSIFSEQQVETITLNVLADNKNAMELYKKCDFEVLSTITQPIKKYLMVRRK